jgi:hypothetical protein
MKHPDGYYYYRLETRIVCSKDQMPKHAGKEILPTDPEFSDRWATEPMRQLREQRNQLLAETDWRMVSDYPGSNQTEWQTYRQSLRDITTQSPSLDENGQLTGITWPTPPND